MARCGTAPPKFPNVFMTPETVSDFSFPRSRATAHETPVVSSSAETARRRKAKEERGEVSRPPPGGSVSPIQLHLPADVLPAGLGNTLTRL